jgi:hypothetical protein
MIVTVNTGTVAFPVNNYAVSPNTWYHVAVTYNNSNLVTYVNGASINNTALTGNFVVSSANSRLRIGAMGSTSGNNGGFNGTIDDFRVYNRALSATEVSTLYTTKPNVSISVTNSNTGMSNYVGIMTPNAQQALEVGGNIMCTGNISAGNLGMFRNRIINGDMRISQRGTITATGVSGPKVYGLDRWYAWMGQPSTGTVTFSQGTVPTTSAPYNTGLRYTNLITATVGNAGSYNVVPMQVIEGFNIVDFGWGTNSGSYASLSFWIRTNAAAGSTLSISIQNSGQTYSYNSTFTIITSNVFQFVSVVIPPPPVGSTWLNDTNAGIFVGIGSYQSSVSMAPSPNIWYAANYNGVTGSTNILGTTGNFIEFTGVQFEKGNMVTPFEFRPYAIELQLCQRYFYRFGTSTDGNYLYLGHAVATLATAAALILRVPVPFRSIPSSITGSATGWSINGATPTFGYNGGGASAGNSSVVLDVTTSGLTVGSSYIVGRVNNYTATIDVNAEL